jgi:hypothetical protein
VGSLSFADIRNGTDFLSSDAAFSTKRTEYLVATSHFQTGQEWYLFMRFFLKKKGVYDAMVSGHIQVAAIIFPKLKENNLFPRIQ